METRSPSRESWHVPAYLLLVAVATAIYSPLLDIQPLRGDNLYVLAWVDHAPFSALLHVDPAFYPEWRPLAYLTIWIEYRLFGLAGVPYYLFINIVLWASCAWLVYRIVDELTGEARAGIAAALWLLADPRAIEGLSWIVERQTSLACLFGLIATLIVARARHRSATPVEAVMIGAALLASALSKEYGLAFAVAFVGYGIFRRRPRALAAAIGAVAVYGAVRAATAGFGVSGYCEEAGFFNSIDVHCVDLRSQASLGQMAYNAVASVIGTVMPGVLGDEGAFATSRARMLRAIGMLILGVAALRFGGPVMRMLAMVPIANGLLGFMLYRERNQLIGVCAIAIIGGAGAALWLRQHDGQRVRHLMRAAIVAFLAGSILVRMADSHLHARAAHRHTIGLEPCESSVRQRPYGDRFVRMVKHQYRLPNANCDGD